MSPIIVSLAALLDFGLLCQLPSPRHMLSPQCPAMTIIWGQPSRAVGACVRKNLMVPRKLSQQATGPPRLSSGCFSSLPSDSSSYSSLPGIHVGPPALFSRPHRRSTHLIYFLKGCLNGTEVSKHFGACQRLPRAAGSAPPGHASASLVPKTHGGEPLRAASVLPRAHQKDRAFTRSCADEMASCVVQNTQLGEWGRQTTDPHGSTPSHPAPFSQPGVLSQMPGVIGVLTHENVHRP